MTTLQTLTTILYIFAGTFTIAALLTLPRWHAERQRKAVDRRIQKNRILWRMEKRNEALRLRAARR